MFLKNQTRILSVSLLVFFISPSCAIITSPTQLPTSPAATKTLQTEFGLTAASMETESLKDIMPPPTPIVTNTPTPVPPGVFAFLFYPPLIMNYDTSKWKRVDVGFLQSLVLEKCQLEEVGPSGNFPIPDEILQLGDIRYQVTVSDKTPPGLITALYIEDQSLNGYDYSLGVAVVMLQAKPSEWDECKTLGEMVLSTLHVP